MVACVLCVDGVVVAGGVGDGVSQLFVSNRWRSDSHSVQSSGKWCAVVVFVVVVVVVMCV